MCIPRECAIATCGCQTKRQSALWVDPLHQLQGRSQKKEHTSCSQKTLPPTQIKGAALQTTEAAASWGYDDRVSHMHATGRVSPKQVQAGNETRG